VHIYDFAEGKKEGLHTVANNGTVLVDKNREGNPSGSRDGLKISLSCEACDTESELSISQHKGRTYFKLYIVTEDYCPYCRVPLYTCDCDEEFLGACSYCGGCISVSVSKHGDGFRRHLKCESSRCPHSERSITISEGDKFPNWILFGASPETLTDLAANFLQKHHPETHSLHIPAKEAESDFEDDADDDDSWADDPDDDFEDDDTAPDEVGFCAECGGVVIECEATSESDEYPTYECTTSLCHNESFPDEGPELPSWIVAEMSKLERARRRTLFMLLTTEDYDDPEPGDCHTCHQDMGDCDCDIPDSSEASDRYKCKDCGSSVMNCMHSTAQEYDALFKCRNIRCKHHAVETVELKNKRDSKKPAWVLKR
jgi:hypothetical protein